MTFHNLRTTSDCLRARLATRHKFLKLASPTCVPVRPGLKTYIVTKRKQTTADKNANESAPQ